MLEPRAVLFDIGDTLSIREPDRNLQTAIVPQMLALLKSDQNAELFAEQVAARFARYMHWREATLIEACEQELWTRWLLPDWPEEQVGPLAGELTRLWQNRDGRRVLRPEAPTVVRELFRRGYRLGIISNTISSNEGPECLRQEGLIDCFSMILLSSTFGSRKPDPVIFREAARQVGVEPARCVYVGDRPSRDVVGPRSAGYAMNILLVTGSNIEDASTASLQPDRVIHQLSELLELFPAIVSTNSIRE